MRRWHVIERFIRENGYTRGAELGVWDGRCYQYLTTHCQDLHLIGVDLYAPQPDNEGPEKWIPGESGHNWDHETYYKNITEYIDFIGRGEFIRDYTYNAALKVADNSLDFIFIDADHSEEGVRKDIEMWSPKVREGGMIIGHDIDWPSVKKVVEETYGNRYGRTFDNVWYVLK